MNGQIVRWPKDRARVMLGGHDLEWTADRYFIVGPFSLTVERVYERVRLQAYWRSRWCVEFWVS